VLLAWPQAVEPGAEVRFRKEPAMTCPTNLAVTSDVQTMPELTQTTVTARRLNQTLWQLLTKPDPLTAAEWALVEEFERQC
jgi:hypothetical protein